MKQNPFTRFIVFAAIIGASLISYAYYGNNSQTQNAACSKEKCAMLMGQTDFIIWNSFTNDF